jgi:hypothetical protein
MVRCLFVVGVRKFPRMIPLENKESDVAIYSFVLISPDLVLYYQAASSTQIWLGTVPEKKISKNCYN